MRLFVALLLVLLAAVPADAQDGATVARNGDVQLLVHDDGDDGDERRSLCLDLRVNDDDASGTCGTAPTGRMSSLTLGATTPSRSFFGGAVPAAGTAEIELEFGRGERVRARTVVGEAYTGDFAGQVAFFLAETTGVQRAPTRDGDQDEPVLIRRFDVEGNLIGASSASEEGGPTIAGPQTLKRVSGLTVTASASRRFAPSVIQLDRTETVVCLNVQRATEGGGGGTCAGTGPALPRLALVPQRECGRGLLMTGFTGPEVKAVELTLGSGRRMRTDTLDVSALGTPARAVVALVPPGQAARSARALDAAGKVVDTQSLLTAPVPRRCEDGNGGWLALYGHSPTALPSAEAGQVVAGAAPGPRLVARDDGDHLCLGIDDFASDAHECLVPPPETDFPQQIERRTAAYSAVAGLVPHGAATVRVVFEGGVRVNAEISEGGDYAGRYGGHVRFYLAHTAPGRSLELIETFDAAGNLLSSLPGPDAGASRPRTVARGRGYRVTASRYDFRFKFPGQPTERSRGTCFSLAFRGRSPDPSHCMPLEHGFVLGEVSCSPRRGAVVGHMTKGLRGVRFELAGGGHIDARIIRVPRRLGGGRLWLLDIPPRARVARLRYIGRLPKERFGPRPQKVRAYPLPAPRRQCGYALDVTF